MLTDVAEVLAELGIDSREIPRKDGGSEYQARCPWHHEGTKHDEHPSWSINADTAAFICYGCGWSGGLPELVYRVAGLEDYNAALAWLRGRYRFDAERILARIKPEPVTRHVPTPMTEARLRAYDEPPQWALEARRISTFSASRYEVRWDPRREAWILPIRDTHDGALLGWQVKGQKDRFFRNLPVGVPKSTTLFGVDHLNGKGIVLVVESPLDAVYLYELGYRAVATYGAKVSTAQMGLLADRTEGIVLALDNDDAGWKAAHALVGIGKRRGTDWSRVMPIWLLDWGPVRFEDGGPKDLGDLDPDEALQVIRRTHINPFTLQIQALTA